MGELRYCIFLFKKNLFKKNLFDFNKMKKLFLNQMKKIDKRKEICIQ